jgi:hypothetical protein
MHNYGDTDYNFTLLGHISQYGTVLFLIDGRRRHMMYIHHKQEISRSEGILNNLV